MTAENVAFSCDHEGDPPATGRGRATPHGSAGSGEGADKPAATSSPEREITVASVLSVRVSFDADLRLVGDEVPATLDADSLAQAVQDSIGYSGVKVSEVFDWEVIESRG